MTSLELSDWLYLGGPILFIILALVVLKVAYQVKSFAALPAARPRFCVLPKYVVPVPLGDADAEVDLSARLGDYGFHEVRRDRTAIVYNRGSALGDFSIKITKLVATAPLPLANPARLNVEYGVAFGCAFDTGDLWKFCRELAEKIEAANDRQAPARKETGNPYQPPHS
jgi:hypothetical protein